MKRYLDRVHWYCRSPWQQKADSLINPATGCSRRNPYHAASTKARWTSERWPRMMFRRRPVSRAGTSAREAVTVTKVRTTCGCTAAELPAGRILPGESPLRIVLTYHPKNHPGTIDTDAFVHLSYSGKTSVARLTLTECSSRADEWARYPWHNGPTEAETEPDGISGSDARKATFRRILCEKRRQSRCAAVGTHHSEVRNIPDGNWSDITGRVEADIKGNDRRFTDSPPERKRHSTFRLSSETLCPPSDRTWILK